ncbi:Matrixin [Symmachiella dynata]|uniref:matrixin family metalloprotease n=1 Tax=Symmachiella dynata TaxID=2527995 RepID=UPI00118CA12B|nr:matrixin family metalloprotease [Symmachiella dynata]QDT50533.1 Matrixin [Symmachiella dynata]
MGIETTLLLAVAKKLLTKWKNQLPADDHSLLPSEVGLMGGIENLALRNEDLLSTLEGAQSATTAVLDAVTQKIKGFQSQIDVLRNDEILGTKSLDQLLTLFGCNHKPEAKSPQPEEFRNKDPKGRQTNELWFLYHIESTPDFVGASDCIRDAWYSWKEFISLNVWELNDDNKEKANVIIRTKYIDGGGPILGQAHVGPPNGYVLELEMDKGHSWTKTRFEGAVCHEIGHLLGLDHTPGDGHLMSEYIKEGIVSPSQVDINNALALGHYIPALRPTPEPEPPGPYPGESEAARRRREIQARYLS